MDGLANFMVKFNSKIHAFVATTGNISQKRRQTPKNIDNLSDDRFRRGGPTVNQTDSRIGKGTTPNPQNASL